MSRHVPGMVRIRSDLSIAPSRRKCEYGVLRIVESMNDVVSRSRMIRILLENIHCNGPGAHLPAETFISGANGTEQRECVEAGGFQIIGIVVVDLLHCLG